jgi:hypothetical protein
MNISHQSSWLVGDFSWGAQWLGVLPVECIRQTIDGRWCAVMDKQGRFHLLAKVPDVDVVVVELILPRLDALRVLDQLARLAQPARP